MSPNLRAQLDKIMKDEELLRRTGWTQSTADPRIWSKPGVCVDAIIGIAVMIQQDRKWNEIATACPLFNEYYHNGRGELVGCPIVGSAHWKEKAA